MLVPAPPGVSPALLRAAALTVFAIGLWATAAIPEELTAIAFFLFAMLFAVVPLEAGAEAKNFASLVGIASATGFVTAMAGVPAALTPPLVVAMQLGGVRLRDALRITLPLPAVELAVLTPTNFFWRRWLGVFNP